MEGAAAPPAGGPPGEAPRTERTGRGRRGRRRGRRGGGGGMREQVPGGAPAEAGESRRESAPEGSGAGPSEGGGNGHVSQEPLPRQYHAEPREAAHELAHFEPAPRPEGPGGEHKPYVVWSSAPAEKPPGTHGPEVPEE